MPAPSTLAGLSSTDRRLLGLLGEHGVLTTGQLVRLTELPERTVQHRLGRLHRAGLVSRFRPEVPVGTAPGWAREGSNLRPRDYESPALTTELRALARLGVGAATTC